MVTLTTRDSRSPSGESFPISDEGEQEAARLRAFADRSRETVAVQGIGFVGSAMVAALARACDEGGRPLYNVVGVDCADPANYWKIAKIRRGEPPVDSGDHSLADAIRQGHERGNLTATSNATAYALADVVVIDINLDVRKDARDLGSSSVNLPAWIAALTTVAESVREDALIVVETTVPPGTTAKVVAPLFREALARRGLDPARIAIAHAPERVMPGARYLESITRFHRVFAGIDPDSARRARTFLESYIDTERFPLTELHSTTASETAKVLENAYRATNIAFIQEWTEFAHLAGVDLFQVIDAIRMRPTHSNLRQPGLGVGGYCLTKDSLLANWSQREFFGGPGEMPQSVAAVSINDRMPEFTCRLISHSVAERHRRTALILGVSYLNDVADTRFSPSEFVYDFCQREFGDVKVFDPYIRYWPEKGLPLPDSLPSIDLSPVDTLLFLVGHQDFAQRDAEEWLLLCPRAEFVIDANRVLSDKQRRDFTEAGLEVIGTGRGHWATHHP